MRKITKNWQWKAFCIFMAIFLGTASLAWSQEKKAPERDPSTITVVPLNTGQGGRAVGDDCTNPIIVSVPAALPYTDNNYTCGRLNDYDLGYSSCMSYYSGGEDIIYRLDVTVNTVITLTLNPLGTTYPGMGIFSGCPSLSNCIAASYNSGSNNCVISNVSLTAGSQYYVMIDTWPAPNCIPAFILTIVAEVPPPPPPPGSCDYTINLYDSYGDGWNGCSIDVIVDGVTRLNDVTLASGYGPAIYTFPANSGAVITTQFNAGSFASEPYYYIYNSEGQQVWYAPAGNYTGPTNILPGQLYGSCPQFGDVEGYVFNYDGLAVSGATIGEEGGSSTTSGPDGHYLLLHVTSGNTPISAGKAGYNVITDIVTVETGLTVTHDFTLTQPNMVVNPLYIEETLNPNEYFTTSVNVLNNGNGPLEWEAEIQYPETENASGNYTINPPGYQPEQVQPNGPASVGYGEATENGSRDLMLCPEGSLFSIPPVSPNNGYTSTLSAGYKCYQSFSGVTGNISSVTFWGIFSSYTLPASPVPFLIELRQPGGTPGAVVTTVTASILPVNTGQILLGSYQIGQFTVEVPSTALAAGWLSVQFTSSPIFYWLNTMSGSGFPAMQNTLTLTERLAMCLGGGGGAGGNWLTMDYYEGTTPPFGGVNNIPTHLDAAGKEAGQVFTADIVFTSEPNVATITVPVTMIIMGAPLSAPENLEVTLVDDVTGLTHLSWEWAGDSFQFFLIKRNGQIIGTTTNLYYNDVLPIYGEYCYTVQAVYDEGATSPAGPECVEWPNPNIYVNPMSLQAWVWPDHQVKVYTTIYNTGVGTLSYTFPDYAPATEDTRAYCSASGGCDEYIMKVQMGTINNTTGCSGYADYTGLSTQVIAGETYPITVTNGVTSYSTDQCGIWIDWNHDENWTNDGNITVSGSPGVGPYTANITVPNNVAGGPTRMRIRICYSSTPQPCGSSTYGEVEDYTLNVLRNFIVSVEPNHGLIAGGESQQIEITYDATGFNVGDYFQALTLKSNDIPDSVLTIGNTMHVYMPGEFAGMVYDRDDNSPLNGVTVTAGQFQTLTDENGEYSLFVDQGEYDVVFEKLGYTSVTVADTFALAGVITPITIGMWDMSYAPGMVIATVMDNDTWCEVTWTLPEGPYEIAMDDGEADDYFIYSSAGSANAVKFTPLGYPATVIGGRIYVGDGNFPGPFLGSEFSVAIFDDDGPNGLPGTMLDSSAVTVNNYGWVSFDWLNATFEDGDFYLAMIQTAPSPFSAPIGVDLDNPTFFRSYSHFLGAPDWILSPLQDFMIRAYVDGPQSEAVTENASPKVWRSTPRVPENWQKYAMTASGTVPKILSNYERTDATYRGVEGMSNRDVTNYRVARYSNFDPNGSPANGTLSELATTTNLYYNDNAFGGLPMGWYAYGVKALYNSGQYSNYTISNIVGHNNHYTVTVNCTLSDGLEPINCEVTLLGLEYPYETYYAVTPASGTVVFDMVWRGHYDITAFKIGYDVYKISNSFINANKTYNILLGEKKYPPTCLVVDPVSSIATWCEPLRTALDEGFENSGFPPAGWQVLTEGDGPGWERTADGSSSGWAIPAWDSYYAMSNDYLAGSNSNGCCDYLITPAMDMRESEGYSLKFNSFYDGAFGQLAFVEYSVDGGATWEVLTQMTPATSWTDQELDLSSFSGLTGPAKVWFAFHSDDAGAYASGWAIDNVLIQVPAPAANYLDFWVFLDDAFKGVTTETTWDYAPLMYGQHYTASVAARYTSGLSAKDYYTFSSKYLFPPDSLMGTAPDNAAILAWYPPVTVPIALTAGISYEEYLAQNGLQNIRSNDAPSAGPAPNANINVPGVNPFAGIRDLDSKAWACDALAIEMVTFTLGTPGTLNYLGPGASNFISAADIVDGVYYGTIYGGTFVTMDTATGAFTTIGSTADLTGLAFDYTTATMYGVDFSGTLYTIDLETGASTVIGSTGGTLIDCACDNDGILYAVDIASDVFGSIDKETAAFTTIANLPFDANYAQGMQCDHQANVVYHAAYNNSLGAGQLYSVEQATGTYTLIGNFQGNTEVDGFAMPGGGIIPGGGDLPENLLGYNIYRDNGFVAYTPHTPPEELVWQHYVDEGLQPGIYDYTVTAVYDLTPYGYPGETGESMAEGPAEVTVDYCFALEFMETWSLGNFDDNHWTADGANWGVNGQAGNPAPAAEFHWSPIQTNYSMTLESYPLCAVGMTEGRIWFDFDLKLESVQPTGEEMLQAQVWNWDSQSWSTVATYSNVDGSFAWTSKHIDIKALAMDKVFKIRFLATGVNSLNILNWDVDNIHVYRACDGPAGLTAIGDGNQGGIVLNWTGPDTGEIDEWIHWDNGVNAGNSIGTGAAAEFDAAARWDAAQLTDYEGASVTEIAFFPAEANCVYSVRVWMGPLAVNMVVDQLVSNPLIGQWNYVTLTTPVPVDVTQELWIGYHVNTQAGYPAGVDAGPAIDGYGDMMNFGGWQTLLEINPTLDFNWNISGHLVTLAGVSMPLSKNITPVNNVPGMTFAANPNIDFVNHEFAPGNGSRELTGFNIYRNKDGEGYVLLDFTAAPPYVDNNDLIIGSNYCYQVSAVWASETDQCESAFSNEACEVWTSIGEGNNSNAATFNMYPNPANEHVFITSSADLKRVTVYNALGQLVVDEITTGKQYELNTASYTIGVYMVRVETATGVTTRTLTIQR